MNAIEKALTKVFGSANERLLKKLWPVVARINAFGPAARRLGGAFARSAQTVRAGGARRDPAGSLRLRARSLGAVDGHAPFRRAVDRRDDPAPWDDRRDAHRRG